jgi:hypothetical protein
LQLLPRVSVPVLRLRRERGHLLATLLLGLIVHRRGDTCRLSLLRGTARPVVNLCVLLSLVSEL